jgi:hypothetical protein
MDNDLIRQRFGFLKGERTTPEERWDAIEQYIAPYRGEFFRTASGEQGVELDKSQVVDGTALQASQNLAANLHGNLTSPYVQWFGLSFRSEALRDDPDSREWLEECGVQVWQTLNESNFSHEIAENYLDLVTFATTFMFEEALGGGEEWQGAVFSALPLKECFFEEDASGRISHFYRLLSWTPLQLLDKFGDALPDDLKELARGPAAVQTRHEVIFCVFPRHRKPVTGVLPPRRRPFGYKYVLRRDGALLGKEGGYYEMPVFVARWAKVSDSKWGHGPSHVAIYDVQALNRQEALTLDALEKVIDPPQKATERGVIGDVDLQPGGLTIVRSLDSIAPMTFGSEWNVVNMERNNRRDMIREYYMVSKLDMKDSPAMTATEVERRWQQMQKVLGPTLGRLQMDLLEPAIQTTFNLLRRANRLPPPPAAIMEAGAENLDIEYTGPLPVAQKADIAAAIERELGLASNLAQTYGPAVLDAIDATKALQEHAKLTAVPAKLLRTKREIEKLVQQREQQQAEQAKLAQAEQAARAVKDAGAGAASMAQAGQMQGELPPTEDIDPPQGGQVGLLQ